MITKQAAVSFLQDVNILTAAIVGPKGPISTPLLFAVEDDLSKLYIATRRDTYKAQALLQDPRFSASIWAFNQMCIQLDGTAQEVEDPSEIARVFDMLTASVGRLKEFWPPLLRVEGDSYIIFAITPTWARSLDLSSSTIMSGDNPFTEIEI